MLITRSNVKATNSLCFGDKGQLLRETYRFQHDTVRIEHPLITLIESFGGQVFTL